MRKKKKPSAATLAARELGRLGGKAGRGAAKRRGDSDYYRKLRAMRKPKS